MRVHGSARSGTATPISREPYLVRVDSFFCKKFLISWSIEIPDAQPAGGPLPALNITGVQAGSGQKT